MDYPRWIAEALRAVARRALDHAAREGLPGDHRLYVSFRTGEPGVVLAPDLRELHPGEMTVILQNQFWDLEVDEDGFSVTLAFGGSRQHLSVPWGAVTAFADPAAELGLRFEPAEPETVAPGEAAPGQEASPEPAPGPVPVTPAGPPAGGEVVSMDRFRRQRREE